VVSMMTRSKRSPSCSCAARAKIRLLSSRTHFVASPTRSCRTRMKACVANVGKCCKCVNC
jgi:hypothetical protein